VVRGTERRGFEVKLTAQPDVNASMRAAMNDLELKTLDVVQTGDSTFPLTPGIRAVALHLLLEDEKRLQSAELMPRSTASGSFRAPYLSVLHLSPSGRALFSSDVNSSNRT